MALAHLLSGYPQGMDAKDNLTSMAEEKPEGPETHSFQKDRGDPQGGHSYMVSMCAQGQRGPSGTLTAICFPVGIVTALQNYGFNGEFEHWVAVPKSSFPPRFHLLLVSDRTQSHQVRLRLVCKKSK